MRSLEKVFILTRSRSEPFPMEFLGGIVTVFCNQNGSFLPATYLRLYLQSDNTVKEIRNQYASRILTALMGGGVFSAVSINHLEVGHTHEDVDGVLSLCKAAIDGASTLETPRDVQQCLQRRLEPVFAKRGMALDVEMVSSVSCWGIVCFYLVDL